MQVTCFGSGQDVPSNMYREMMVAGRLLAERGVTVATGAFQGIGMEAPLRGAAESGHNGKRVGYSYGDMPPNRYVSELVNCKALAASIPFDADYCIRLAGLLSSDAFIIAGGGGPGTFLELSATINFNQKFWTPRKRVAILEPHIDGRWNENLLAQLSAWGVLSGEVHRSIRVVGSARQAVDWCCDGVEP